MSLTTNYERNQSAGNGYSDSIYFAGSFISKKNGIYTFNLDANDSFNTKFCYERNIDGFDFSFNINSDLFSEMPNNNVSFNVSSYF